MIATASSEVMARPAATAGLADWLHYQERLHARPIELGLSRVSAVAERLALCPARVPTVIVGGTNGKGSASTLISRTLGALGLRVGLYTSPHLLHYRERIAVAGRYASDTELVAAFAAVESARGDTALTYFEFGTLAALALFRAREVDVQVLEVGLGGRLDAVNIVDADVALITSIGLDHTDWLGDSRERIGFEKAGIFRRGRVALCADEDPPASIQAQAALLGAELRQLGRDFGVEPGADGWRWRAAGRQMGLPQAPTPLPASTLAGAVAAVEALRPAIGLGAARVDTRIDEALAQALSGLRMPGRCEHRGAFVFDVSHNREAAAVLAAHLRAHGGAQSRWRLVLGMLADKPVEAYCNELREQIGAVHFASLGGPRGLTASALAARAASAGLTGSEHASVADAVAAAQAAAGNEAGIVICGSFLTVEAALTSLYPGICNE